MRTKKWVTIWFRILLTAIPIIAIINYIVDPLWIFTHKNNLNTVQKSFNERQQKTNHIYFNGLEKYDSLLLGSSRTTYINQNDFHNMSVYNYAFNDSSPHEFSQFIEFAKEVKGEDFKNIIIGADFVATEIPSVVKSKHPEVYINNVKSFAYKYKTILSFDALKESIKNIKYSMKGTARVYYDRDNIKYRTKLSEEARLEKYNYNMNQRLIQSSEGKYHYDNNYLKRFKKIKADNPNSNFLVFTTPVSANLLVTLLRTNHRFPEYKRWLNELLEVFGEVHHYMSINTITTNLENYPDAEHYYPHIAKLLANKSTNKSNPDIPNDFGIILNKHNVDEFLNKLEIEVNNYNLPKGQ